ncbi:MAG TPA: sugar phosphate isomerase/epimerase [Aliidongia sp.]|uniref:sugar phosphate isomerase/epimerase family protein n=1 Tax=Aliidongia sp. TaxID=1914230 RepID=UPI002DDD37A5|nr:sugar phosphate isomerase/epimerase [Aliidongia sp.]HEV2677368.1 sugar phosphate isomerase/epimerase [Aliidongia sp.]
MNPLSLSYYTVPELDPPKTVDVAAACGCDHVGLRLLGGQPDGEQPPVMTDPVLRRMTLGRLKDTGVTVLDANTARLTPATVVSKFRPFFEVASAFGARHALATADDPDRNRLSDRLAELCDLAAEHAMMVQLEFVPWMAIASVTDAADMVRRVGRPNLGIALDALHFDRSGGRFEELADMPPAWFAYMHLCDAPAEWAPDKAALLHTAVKERLFPGEGGIDLVGLLRALPANIPLALEIPTETLARTVPARERVARAVAAARRVAAAAQT